MLKKKKMKDERKAPLIRINHLFQKALTAASVLVKNYSTISVL